MDDVSIGSYSSPCTSSCFSFVILQSYNATYKVNAKSRATSSIIKLFFMAISHQCTDIVNTRHTSGRKCWNILLRLFPCSDGVGVFRQPFNQPWLDCFGLTFGFGCLATKVWRELHIRCVFVLFLWYEWHRDYVLQKSCPGCLFSS
jgi:hypothetical protein